MAEEETLQKLSLSTKKLKIDGKKLCNCSEKHINCLTAKEWVKSQVAIQAFYYQGRDVRDKNIHPATFPLTLPTHFIKLFTHEGELVLDPFAGIGTTLLAAKDLNRNAVGFDLKTEYIDYARKRLSQTSLKTATQQILVCDDAINIPKHIEEGTVSLSITSPPYANMLNHKRKNKSMRANLRENEHYMKVQQFSKKIPGLVIVYAKSEEREGVEWFNFHTAKLLKGTTPETLSTAIRTGTILIDLRLHDKGTMARNHGTGFRVKEKDLEKIFSHAETLM